MVKNGVDLHFGHLDLTVSEYRDDYRYIKVRYSDPTLALGFIRENLLGFNGEARRKEILCRIFHENRNGLYGFVKDHLLMWGLFQKKPSNVPQASSLTNTTRRESLTSSGELHGG